VGQKRGDGHPASKGCATGVVYLLMLKKVNDCRNDARDRYSNETPSLLLRQTFHCGVAVGNTEYVVSVGKDTDILRNLCKLVE
jgi:hypothetical protein